MIYHVSIGDVEATIDDDQNETSVMPDFAVDYLARCAQVAWATYSTMVNDDAEVEASE